LVTMHASPTVANVATTFIRTSSYRTAMGLTNWIATVGSTAARTPPARVVRPGTTQFRTVHCLIVGGSVRLWVVLCGCGWFYTVVGGLIRLWVGLCGFVGGPRACSNRAKGDP
jgi:hypothetical protein